VDPPADAEIRLEGIVKRFGDIVAVDGVDLVVECGAFFTLLGPSGSGKSTLLHIMGGFEPPSAGRVFFRDDDVTELPANRRASSTVFQDLALFPHKSVGANVEYGLKIRGVVPAERRRRAEEMLELVGLAGFHGRDVNRLSGGQRQRVALARALVVRPIVLLLDEPLTGLDEMLRQQMQSELKRIHAELGTTFVAVTHNQEEALSMSTKVAVLREGRLEQVGSPRDLYEEPRNAFVADFVGAANLLRGRFDAARPGELTIGTFQFRLPSAATDGSHGATAVIAVRPEHIRVGEAAAKQPNRCRLRVKNVLYKGATLEYHFEFPDGQELRARVSTSRTRSDFAQGAEADVGWPAEETRLLPGIDGGGARVP